MRCVASRCHASMPLNWLRYDLLTCTAKDSWSRLISHCKLQRQTKTDAGPRAPAGRPAGLWSCSVLPPSNSQQLAVCDCQAGSKRRSHFYLIMVFFFFDKFISWLVSKTKWQANANAMPAGIRPKVLKPFAIGGRGQAAAAPPSQQATPAASSMAPGRAHACCVPVRQKHMLHCRTKPAC